MSETRWTPGPWTLETAYRDEDLLSVVYVSEDNQEFPIAEEVGGRRHGADFEDESECVANAHLIAAAPELYEALEECKRVLSDLQSTQLEGTRTRAAWEKARAALAKARGE